MSGSLLRSTLARVAALALLSPAAFQPVRAQAPGAADTAAVLDAVAAALSDGETRPDSGTISIAIRFWHVAPGDSLTARLAAAARYTTAPAPDDALCPFPGASEGVPTAYVTKVNVTFAAADTAVVMVTRSCRRPRPSAVGTHFAQGDTFDLIRRGGRWRIVSRSFFVT